MDKENSLNGKGAEEGESNSDGDDGEEEEEYVEQEGCPDEEDFNRSKKALTLHHYRSKPNMCL